MAKIRNKLAYPLKKPVETDYFVGSDSESDGKTVNFNFPETAQAINIFNGIDNYKYLFSTDPNINLAVLTEGTFLTDENKTSVSEITQLYVNRNTHNGTDLIEFYQFVGVNYELFWIQLKNTNNLNNYVYFDITAIQEFQDYFIFDVVIYRQNTAFSTLENFGVYFFDFEIKQELPEPIDISGKEDKSNKGIANGYAPLDEFVKIASTYLNIVNDLVTGGATSLLSAEQGKQAQLQIDAITAILFSDNVNLDTVQEIVDAIESLQGYLDTILVNDLTTGGTTKALTAEMGKTLKGLIDSLTTVVSDLSNDVTNIDTRLTVLENFNPSPESGFTGRAVAVWSGTGLTYNITTSTYYLDGVLYPAITDTITLDTADPTNSRFDSIIADVNGVNKITGVAEENPAAPTLEPNTQLLITNVLILAGATTPEGTNQNIIYDEGGETEVVAVGANLQINNTTDPFIGTKCLNVGYTTASGVYYFDFIFPEDKSIVDAEGFKFFVKFLRNVTSSRGFRIQFYQNTTPVSDRIDFIRASASGSTFNSIYGITYNNLSNYQLVYIPYSDFNFDSSTFNKLRIEFTPSVEMKLDYLALVSSGGTTVSPDKKGIKTIVTDSGLALATTSEDTFNVLGRNGTKTSASGKTIFVDASTIDIIWHKYAWTTAGNISISGTTATSSAGAFESDMVGAKIKVGDYDFIISSYSSPTSVQIAANPYGTVTAPNGSWGIYNKAIEISSAGSVKLYGTSSPVSCDIFGESTMILPDFVTTIGSLIGISADSIQMTSGVDMAWRSGNLATDSTRDVGIRRNAAGVLEVFDGITAGQYRDMVVRNISGATATAPEHYVPKSQMEAADADTLADANDYTDTGLALKLNIVDYNDRFKGVYVSEAALNSAHPTASAGDSAQVNEVGATDVVNYSWDAEESIWVQGGSGGGAVNTDALPEGTTNLYFTTARVLATVLTGLSLVTGGAIVSTDSVLQAFGKIQKQLNDGFTTANIKSLLGITVLSGDNTGDQTITLTGDVTGSGTGSFVATLASVVSATTKGTSSKTVTITVDAKGRVTAISEQDIILTPNVQSVSSSATVTPVSTNDEVIITAQAANLTLANPTGAFSEGQALIIRIKDNGTARTITFGSNYRAIGITLPTTTTISKTLYLAIIYNNTDSKWDVVGTRVEA